MDTREVVARFAAEQQALALMDHPSIARIFDASVTQEGRPYFVMEFVRGVPLNEHCDTARLNIRQRLELFMQACAAVQHTHHKAIIHLGRVLAMIYERQGRLTDAIRTDEATLQTRRRTIGSDHPNTLRTMNNLATGYVAVGRFDDARHLLNEAITSGQRVWGDTHPSVAIAVHSLGELELAAGKYVAALDAFNRALAIYERQSSHQFLPQLLYQVAQANARLGNKDAAFDYLDQSSRAGFTPKPRVEDDRHFVALRSDPRFKKWELAPR